MFDLDLARLHAAVNDLPAALLLVSVLFDLLGAIYKRDSLRAAGFWTLIAGVLGVAGAVLSGLAVEGRLDHTDEAHAVMQTHKTIGIMVALVFGLLALWRVMRRGVWSPRELPVALTAGVMGVGLMIYASRLGGSLVFDHAMGLPTTRLEAITSARGGLAHAEHEHAPGDSAAGDTTGTHTHADDSTHQH